MTQSVKPSPPTVRLDLVPDPATLSEPDPVTDPLEVLAAPLPVRSSRRARATPRGSDIVAGVPIAGFTGINGAGKTLLAVHSAIHDIAGGREVYSTVPITSPWGNSIPLTSLRQLL